MQNFSFLTWILFLLKNNWQNFLYGTFMTVFISLTSTIVGFIIGLALALVQTAEINNKNSKFKNILLKVSKWLIKAYVTIFRGTPMIVQSMIFYYGFSQVTGININPIPSALIIVSVNTGAYISEIVRGGIISIDKGQYEACQSLGMTHNQAMIYVILPQVIRNILPAVSNEFIVNIKDTSVLFVIGVTELFTVSKAISGTYARYYEVFTITCVIYFILTFGLTKILRKFEKYLDGNEHYEIYEEKGE